MTEWLRDLWFWIWAGRGHVDGQGMETLPDWSAPWSDWITLLLLLFGIAFVIVVYLKEGSKIRPLLRTTLIGLRVTLIVLVVLMLYQFVLRRYKTDLPDIVIALDVSQSMKLEDHYQDRAKEKEIARRVHAAGFDKPTRLNQAKTLLLEKQGAFLHALQRQYHVKFCLIGSAMQPQTFTAENWEQEIRHLEANQTASRLGDGVRKILQRQQGRPTPAIIIFTEGNTTEGNTIGDVAAYARERKTRLFPVALGNAQPHRDIRIESLPTTSEVVRVGQSVHVAFKIAASGITQPETIKVQLHQSTNGPILAQRTITLYPGEAPQDLVLSHRPQEPGTFRYTIQAVPLEGETKTDNNTGHQLVRVIDKPIRVLFVQAYPSYEFRYLKNLLSRQTKLFKLTTVLQEADPEYAKIDTSARQVFPVRREELLQYDVIIFGDVNPAFLSQSVMENITHFVKESGRGIAFIAGPRFTPLAYRGTPLANLIPVNLASVSIPDPEKVLVTPFQVRPKNLAPNNPLAQLTQLVPHTQPGQAPNGSANVWKQLPGLYWLLRAPDLKPMAEVILEHPHLRGNDGNPLPVVCVQKAGAGKVLFQCTDATWRWRFRRGDTLYGRYWLQAIRFLCRSKSLGGSDIAELTSDRKTYHHGQPIRLTARFINDLAIPTQDNGATVVLEQKGGKHRRIHLHRNEYLDNVFEATIGNLAEGSYHAWIALPMIGTDATTPDKTTNNHKTTTKDTPPPSCSFVIEKPLGELAERTMNAADLQRAAKESGGAFYTFTDAQRLIHNKLPKGRPIRIEPLPPIPLWNAWFVPLLFISLLLAEWLLRKKARLL